MRARRWRVAAWIPAPSLSRWRTEADGYGTTMVRGLLVAAIAAFAVALAASDAGRARGPSARAGRDPRRGAGDGLERPALSAGASPTARARARSSSLTSTRGRAALRPRGAWLGEAGGYADARQLGRIGVVGGLATDRAGHVYVLDSENDRVQVFASATGRWLAAWGSTGQGPAQLRLVRHTGAGGTPSRQPTAADTPVAYVADQYNHRIQAFTLDAGRDGGRGAPGPAGRHADRRRGRRAHARRGAGGRSGTARRARAPTRLQQPLEPPAGVAVDVRTGHVLVADDDNHRVVEFLPDGTYVRQIGSYGVGAGQFRFPYDVGIDAHEPRQLYVADNNNHRVQAFDFASLAFQRTWGQFGTEVGDFGFTRALAAVADDPTGGVAVADTANNRVQTFAPDGAPTAAWGIAGRGPGYVTRPEGVAIDAAGTRARGRHGRPPRRAPRRRRRVPRADGLHLGQLRLCVAEHGQRPVRHPGRHRGRPRGGTRLGRRHC